MNNEFDSQAVPRYLRGLKHQKTREERKRLKEKARQRRASGAARRRPRPKDWATSDEDDWVPAEKMASSQILGPRSGPTSRPPTRAGEATQPDLDLDLGLVVGVSRTHLELHCDGAVLRAALAGELAPPGGPPLAVGDRVQVVRAPDGSGRAVGLLERRSALSRPDPGAPGRERVLAANVDLAVVVLSVRSPPLKPALIDRFLVALERGGVQPLLCVNKIDLARDAGERERVRAVLAPYGELGIWGQAVSATSGEGLAALRRQLEGRTSVFVGHSGVGKSSLLNALDPGVPRATRPGRGFDGKGRHTTSASTLREPWPGTRVIDTPGVRAFGLWDLTRESLREAFPEFGAFASSCRFGDCSHLVEPGCAVRAAVERGALPRVRFEAYGRLHASLEA